MTRTRGVKDAVRGHFARRSKSNQEGLAGAVIRLPRSRCYRSRKYRCVASNRQV